MCLAIKNPNTSGARADPSFPEIAETAGHGQHVVGSGQRKLLDDAADRGFGNSSNVLNRAHTTSRIVMKWLLSPAYRATRNPALCTERPFPA